MKTVDIDVLIPVSNGYEELVKLVNKMKKQRYVNIVNIVTPITLTNSPADINIKAFCEENHIVSFDVESWYYSHSMTRQRAIKKYCTSKIVVMFSQDVKLINDMAFYNLVKDIDNGECVYAYGRQICPKKSLEKYIREKNYPIYSYFIEKSDVENLGIMAFFSSDAFSALNRDVFIALNGYMDFDVLMGEDMIYSYNVIMNGYKKKYCSDAVVEHWHRYSLKKLYKRYYETGKFFNKVKIFDGYQSVNTGGKLAKYVLVRCLKDFNIIGLIRWLPDMSMRYLGMKRGRRA